MVSIALTLNIANLYGYIKCKGGNQENLGISSMASNFIFQNIGKVRIYLKYSLEEIISLFYSLNFYSRYQIP